jgi:hypothetical protein
VGIVDVHLWCSNGRVSETRRRSYSVEEAADGVSPNDAIFEKASMGILVAHRERRTCEIGRRRS